MLILNVNLHHFKFPSNLECLISRTCVATCRDMLALNVYLAMCYHKLDYYDVSQEVLAGYVQQHPDSAVAINLKACNYYKLYNGKAAEVNMCAG